MIGFACPWCDHQVGLSPQAFADEAVVCTECSTHIDLSIGQASGVIPVESLPAALPLAA